MSSTPFHSLLFSEESVNSNVFALHQRSGTSVLVGNAFGESMYYDCDNEATAMSLSPNAMDDSEITPMIQSPARRAGRSRAMKRTRPEESEDFELSDSTDLSMQFKRIKLPTATMYLTVATLTGKRCRIEIPDNSFVRVVKTRIEHTEGIPIEQQRLVYKGRVIADEKSLYSYGIGDGCTLHLVLVLRGGICSSGRQVAQTLTRDARELRRLETELQKVQRQHSPLHAITARLRRREGEMPVVASSMFISASYDSFRETVEYMDDEESFDDTRWS